MADQVSKNTAKRTRTSIIFITGAIMAAFFFGLWIGRINPMHHWVKLDPFGRFVMDQATGDTKQVLFSREELQQQKRQAHASAQWVPLKGAASNAKGDWWGKINGKWVPLSAPAKKVKGKWMGIPVEKHGH